MEASKKKTIYMAMFLGGSILLSSLAVYFYQIFFSANVLRRAEKPVVLIIPTGATFQQVRDTLMRGAYINHEMSFMVVAKALGYPEKIKPGRYIIKPKMSNIALVRKLRSGDQSPVRVTFNNVRLKKDLAGKIVRNLEIVGDSAKLLQKLSDPALAQKYGFDTTTLMCMFIPNTYELFWTTKEDELLDRMHKEYVKFWNDERKAKAEKIGLTPVQVSILASIVEAETKKKDEAPRVAGVYMNRLTREDRKLRADPTVVYALGDFGIKRVLFEHLKYDSPYNTYLYAGLPPGPINLPSIAAIDAVLNHEKHEYMFFCAKEDFSGYHVFAVDYNEHLQNADRYRKALDRLKIMR